MTGPASFKPVSTQLLEDGTVLRILLDRPKGNILDKEMMLGIAEALRTHAEHPNLRLILLRGAGKHFSFGASIEEHQSDQVAGMLGVFHSLVRQVASYPVPVASLVQGSCLGGAFEMVLCSHFVFATSDARFGCPEIKLGVFPPVLAAIGTLRLGGPATERLLLTGSFMDSATAQQLGLLTEILDGEPEEACLDWYRENLRPMSSFSLRQAAKAVRESCGLLHALAEPLERIERQYLRELVPSRDGNEGIAAFLEHRSPIWEDA